MKKSQKNQVTAIFICCTALIPLASAKEPITSKYAASIATLTKNTPETYPETVISSASLAKVADFSDDKLISLLDHWNPSIRASLIRELVKRPDAVVGKLKTATNSKSPRVREGALSALRNVLKKRLDNPSEYASGEKNRNKAKPTIVKRLGLERIFVKLSKDPSDNVRKLAVKGLISIGPVSKEVTEAVINATFDEDEFIAQEAMIRLEKSFKKQAIESKQIHAAMKNALEFPLPRARGHMLGILAKMDKRDQKRYLPQLHEHFQWRPMRDTMFSGGGKKESLRIMAAHEYKEVLPTIVKMFGVDYFGTNMAKPSLEAFKTFGKDAKPYLEAMIDKRDSFISSESDSNWTKNDLRKRYEAADKIVKHLESL